VYNASEPSGGDPLTVDVNAQFVGYEWNYTYIVFCGFIVWLIIPGIGLLYSGLARRKSALALLFQSLMIVAVYVRFALVVAAIEGPFTNTKGYLEQPSNGYSGVIP
jgi:Amt family ammonium transporter